MTLTVAQQQLVIQVLAPIANDQTDLVRRRITALNRQGILKGVLEEAKGRNLCILQIGGWVSFFNPSKVRWLHNEQPVEQSGRK